MKNISKYVDFYIDCRKSTKKDGKEYYPLIIKVKDVEIFVGFLYKSQYDSLVSSLN